MIKKLFILSGITLFSAAFAQNTHTVAKGESAYGIARKYGMSLDELYTLNPKIKDGNLGIGEVVLIKKNAEKAKANAAAVATSKTASITLKPKQTIYGITKQYKISETDLRKLNPDLDNHMKIGEKVILPLENIQKFGDETPIVNSESNLASQIPVDNQVDPIDLETVADENSYIIQEKDNYFKIGRKFGVSQKQLFAMNPGLEEKGLHAGDVIRVKSGGVSSEVVKEESPAQTIVNTAAGKVSSSDDYVTYTVQNGDTVFGIVNKFGISLDELLELNPSLSNGLKSGMVLKIKKLDAAYVKKSGDALNVVLMLPFGFDSNDSKYRTLAKDFLEGAKLAAERNAANGLKMDIKVIDAGSESSFKNALVQINPDNTDLIIGPFFKSNIVEVLNFVDQHKIPVVAPFANADDLYNYSNLVIVETSEQEYADRITKEVKDVFSDQKIYILTSADQTNAKYLKSTLEKELKNPNVVITSSAEDIQLDQNMMTGQSAPVIAVLASDDNNLATAFSNKIIELGSSVEGVKAFSMFYSPQFDKKTDELSQAHLVYLMDRKIDTEGSFEKEILANFKSKYCKTPSKYNVIGFDVVNDMLSRENKKGEILKNMGKTQTQLATKFEFERAKSNGAFVNKGYRVVRLIP